MGHTFNRPDEAAMLRILERHPHSPEGAILRLAWLEGLSRSEITELRWDQVDFEGKAIQLPDRAVPLEPSTEACLRERHVRCALRDPRVVISERSKKPMPPESISRLSRLALDSEGQKVNLMDLRHDFVIRQLQTHDWPYVARVSGMAVSTLRDAFSPYLTKPAAPENPLAQRDEAEYLLWRVIQQEGSSPAGLALWMGWKLQMQPGEILNLTWSQVDLDRGLLRLPDREIPMGSRLSRLLGVSKSAALKLLNQLRQDGAVVRIGGCYYPAGAVVLPEDQSAAVTAYLAAHGTAVRKELAELLNLPPAQCTALLRRMADRGELLLTGKRYALPPQKKPLETN